MNKLGLDLGTIIKLVIWSMIVGGLLYWLELSTGDIYGWVANTIASAWHWITHSGLEYMLLGATIVVPIFLFSKLRNKR